MSRSALEIDDDAEANDMIALKEEIKRAQDDKIALLHTAQSEMDRMRAEIRQMSKLQQNKEINVPDTAAEPKQAQPSPSYFEWAFTRLWSQ